MTIVLDASAAVMLAAAEPGSVALRERIGSADAIAPDLMLAEVANALWRKVRVGMLSARDAHDALGCASLLIVHSAPCRDLASSALRLALWRDHPVYDAFYVALAAREGATLLTADRRLAERFADDARIELIA